MKKLAFALLISQISFAQIKLSTGNTVTSGMNVGGGTAVILASITISPSSASIAAGTSQSYTAQGTYSDNTTQDVTSSCTWASDNLTVATIGTPANPQPVNGSAAGTANITCTIAGIVSNPSILTVTSSAVFAITTTSLPNGNEGSSYGTQNIASVNGTAPCTWSKTSGTIPAGLTLATGPTNPCSPTTLSGTPAGGSAGNYTFNVHGVDNAGHTADQAYTISIGTLPCSPGPPTYGCSSTSTAQLPPAGTPLTALFQATDGPNTTRYDTTINPSGIDCITQITDERTFGGPFTGTLTNSGGNNDIMWSKNSTYGAIKQNQSKLFKFNTSGNCIQVVWPTSGNNPTDQVFGGFAFSHLTDTRFYHIQGGVLQRHDIDGVGTPTHFVTTDMFDWSKCPHTPGVGSVPTWRSVLGISQDDQKFAVSLSWAAYNEGAQNTSGTMYVWDQTLGCTAWDIRTGNVYGYCIGDCSDTGSHPAPMGTNTSCTQPPATPTGNVGIHDSLYVGGSYVYATVGCVNGSGVRTPSWLVWQFNTTTGAPCISGSGTGCGGAGHQSQGITHLVGFNTPKLVSDPLSGFPASPSSFNTLPTSYWKNGNPSQGHGAWPHPNNDDTYPWILSLAGGCDTANNGSQPGYLCNEFVAVNPNVVNGPFTRFFHNYMGALTTPMGNQEFGCAYTIASVSQDGKWVMWASPMLGAYGNTSTGVPICRVFIGAMQ